MKQLPLDEFMDACGGREPLRLDVTGPGEREPKRYVLPQPFALLGRSPRADVCLADQRMSQRHALVQLIAGRIFCLDLSSRTGTVREGRRIACEWLSGRLPVQVGPYTLRVAGEKTRGVPTTPDDWDPLARDSIVRQSVPTAALTIYNGHAKVCRWRMNRVLALVGSDKNCKVRLRGDGIPRFYCSLVCTPRGTWVVDLQRRGGVLVNGTPTGCALLDDGDRLRVGNFTICLRYDGPAAAANVGAVSDEAWTESWLTEGAGAFPEDEPAFDMTAFMQDSEPAASGGALAPLPPSQIPGGALAAKAGQVQLFQGMLRQFSQMQQQMFQQSLLMMFRMFKEMHGEQVGVLRAELARLDEVNRELRELLVARQNLAPTPPPVQTPPPAPAAQKAPAQPRPPTVETSPAAPRTPAPAAPKSDAATAAPTPRQAAPPPQPAEQDLHILLCQRMEALQRERHGLWQKITGILGKNDPSTGRPV